MRSMSATATRREFLEGACLTTLAAGAGVVVAGCAPSAKTTPTSDRLAPDVRLLSLAASVELALVSAYDAALRVTQHGGRLAPAPPAFAALVAQARAHHVSHAAALNRTLTDSGRTRASNADKALRSLAVQRLSAAQSVSDVASAMQVLELTSTQTYVALAPQLSDGRARTLAVALAAVEAQHAAVLTYLLGAEPLPDASMGVSLARGVGDLRG